MFFTKSITKFGEYLCLMGRVMSVPERWRMFLKQYIKEMTALGQYRNCTAHFLLHRCRDMHTNQA